MSTVYDARTGEIVQLAPPEPEAPAQLTIPAKVTALQARTALRRAGYLEQAEATIAGLGPEAQDAWEYSIEWARSSPMINALADQLGLTPEGVDALFVTAAAIEF